MIFFIPLLMLGGILMIIGFIVFVVGLLFLLRPSGRSSISL